MCRLWRNINDSYDNSIHDNQRKELRNYENGHAILLLGVNSVASKLNHAPAAPPICSQAACLDYRLCIPTLKSLDVHTTGNLFLPVTVHINVYSIP